VAGNLEGSVQASAPASSSASSRPWLIAQWGASLVLALDVIAPGRITGTLGVLGMSLLLPRLARYLKHRDGIGKAKLLLADFGLIFTLVVLFSARAWVLLEQFLNEGERVSLGGVARTYDVIFGILAGAGALFAIMPARFARLTLALSQRPAVLLSGSFALLIAAATLFLMLPFSLTALGNVSFLDALFTATSAVCVTGLSVNDVATNYTRVGHSVILAAMQLGGIGIMTIAALALTFGKDRSLTAQLKYASMLDASTVSDLRKTVRTVVFGTLAIETIGAVLLWQTFSGDERVGESALFYSVFHAISAFCNAGFSLLSGNLAPLMASFSVQLVLMLLIVLGGLGFPVILELLSNGTRHVLHAVDRKRLGPPRLSLASRVVLKASGILIVSGAAIVFLFEGTEALSNLSWFERLLSSVFVSVNTRTSGFSTVDLGAMADGTLMLLCAFMFIGGAPGSTAGGVKVTTAAAIFATLRSELTGRAPHLGNRALLPETFRRATAVVTLSAAFILLALVALTLTENKPLGDLLFEVVSAFCTVGSSTGVTPDLSALGKLIVIFTMFIGRVGPFTIALAVAHAPHKDPYKLASENIPIG
jgi:trk system potassium uptake protein